MRDHSPVTPDVIVAGGGPSGLAAAYRLQQAGHRVRVLEAGARAGSKMAVRRRDGFLLDTGAIFLPSTYDHLLGIAREIGLGDELAEGAFVFGLVAHGQVHHLDGTRPLRSFARLGSLSRRAKAECVRLTPEAARSRLATPARIEEAGRFDTETLAAWAERALTPELRERLVSPAIRGIFASEPNQVSRVEFLGILALFAGARLLAFREGMAAYPDALAARLDVACGAEVREITQTADGARVTWRDAAGEHVDDVRGCVVALPAQLAAQVRPDLDAWRAGWLGAVRRGKVLTPNIALSREPAGLHAAYTMVPRVEHPFVGGLSLDHLKGPGRVPAGKALITPTLMTAWCEAHFEDDDDAIARTVIEAIETLVPGTAGAAEFVEVARWEQQYSPVGHYAQLAEFRARTRSEDRTVHLAGEYLSAPNLNAATASGEAAAAALGDALRPTAQGTRR
jgi:oxygen-dependent protoporphyrinogen oxidase